MVTKIYIIRHAEAEGNIFRRAHGWYDAPLTENGEKQVKNLEKRLMGEHIDAIYSSDLRRTMSTAQAPSRACSLSVQPCAGLRELAMGEWENLSWGDCLRRDAALASSFACDGGWRAPGAESVRDLYERTGVVLFEILHRHIGGSFCLVSHSVAIRALMARMLGGGLDSFGTTEMVANASLSLIEYENGEFRPEFIGENAHNEQNPVFCARPFPGETRRPELWFCGVGGAATPLLAADLWQEAWRSVHGGTAGFDLEGARMIVRELAARDAGAVRFAYCGEELAGVAILDRNPDESGVMHVVLFMLLDKFRGHGLAVQLFGEVLTRARLAGRDTLRLRVAKKNEGARRFYEQNGFAAVRDEGADLLMKRAVERVSVLE